MAAIIKNKRADSYKHILEDLEQITPSIIADHTIAVHFKLFPNEQTVGTCSRSDVPQ